jgi:hypothetical protein
MAGCLVNRAIIVFFISHGVSLVVSEETKQLVCGLGDERAGSAAGGLMESSDT